MLGIVEHKDAGETQRAIDEINSGIYAFDLAVLRDALGRIGTDNAQGGMSTSPMCSRSHARTAARCGRSSPMT